MTSEETLKQRESRDAALMELWSLARHHASRWRSQQASADDVAQEVVLEYVRQQSRVNVPRAWVRVVADRIAFRMGTKRLVRLVSASPRDRGYSPAIDLRIDFLRAFRRLDPRSRKLLIWTARGDTHAQIAVRLGCSRCDIGSLVARARARLANLTDAR